MDYNKEHIDDLFKKELGGYTEAPPLAVWDALEKRLDEKDNRRLYPWLWFIFLTVIGASLGILFAGGGTTQKIAMVNRQHTAPVKTEINNNRQAAVAAIPAAKSNDNEATSHLAVNEQKKQTVTTLKKSNDKNIDTDKPTGNDNEISSNRNEPASNTIAAGNHDDAVLVNKVTKKGNIRVEQAVIKEEKTQQGDNSNLLTDNTAGADNIVIGKKHGIVVQSLPAEKKDNYIAENYNAALPAAQLQPVAVAHQPATPHAAVVIKKQEKHLQPHAQASIAKVAVVNKTTNVQAKSSVPKKENNRRVAVAAKKTVKSVAMPAVAASTPQTEKHATVANAKKNNNRIAAAKTKTNALPAKQAHIEAAVAVTKKKKTLAPKEVVAANNNKTTSQAIAASNTTSKAERTTQTQQPAEPKGTSAKNSATQIAQAAVANPTTTQAKAVNVLSATPPTIAQNTNKNIVTSKKNDVRLPGTFKQPTIPIATIADNSAKGNGGAAADTAAAKKFRNFEFGIKAGYEGGFNNDAARKLVASPYIEYHINSRLSVMSQPAIKSAQVSSHPLSGSQSFYSVNPGGTTRLDSTTVFLIVGAPGGPVDTLIRRSYTYNQSYDSIAKTYKYGGSYIEFEVPLLVKYGLTKSLSIYGGAIITYSKLINITEQTYTSAPITLAGIGPTFAQPGQAAPPPPPYYNGTPISGYKGPLYPSGGDLLRLGYMLGLSYEVNKRFLFDVSLEQSGASPNVQGGYDINKPLSALYYRFTIGYRLSKK